MAFNKTSDFRVDAGVNYDFGTIGMEYMYFACKKDMNWGGGNGSRMLCSECLYTPKIRMLRP